MEFENRSNADSILNEYAAPEKSVSKKYFANVFAYMFLALGISAVVAYLFAANPQWIAPLINLQSGGLSILGYVVLFAPLAFVLLMNFGFAKLSAPVLTAIFLVYSAVTGVTLSFVLLTYTASSVFSCFAGASVMFGVMAYMGYTTDKDLTGMGRLLFMGLIGIVISSVINIFMKSDTMGYVIGWVGIIVFTGLIAYDVQKIKRIGENLDENGGQLTADAKKLSIIGALSLYLDFINLFLMLLRVFGKRD